MHKSYGWLQLKAVDDDQRIIEGIATTSDVDRQDDIVDPQGAKYTLPIPFLMNHGKDGVRSSVGHVISAKRVNEGIQIRAQIKRNPLLPYLDEAWAQIKEGLVRGLSIGFNPIEDPTPIKGGGWLYKAWEWLELSAVVIPANQSASITTIKAADQECLRAALGRNAKPLQVVRLHTSPGASGNQFKGNAMGTMTNAERLEALKADRAATVAQMQAIDQKASDEQRTFNEDEQQKFDEYDQRIKGIDEQIKRAERMAELAITNAKAVQPHEGQSAAGGQAARSPSGNGGGGSILFVRPNIEKGIPMARMVKALAMARGNKAEAAAIAESNRLWMDTSPQVAAALKANIGAGTTTGSGWADDLVYNQNLTGEFVELLMPQTIVGRIPGLRRVPFNVRMGTMTSGGTAYWVGQGAAIPLSKFATGDITLGRMKMAGMMSITEELAESSDPNAERLIRDDLTREIALLLDQSFINPDRAEVANISPASVTNGVTPVSVTGTTAAHLRTDIATLFGKFTTANMPITGGVWIMTQSTATAISLMTNALGQPEFPAFNGLNGGPGNFLGFPVVVSQTALTTTSPTGGNLLIFLIPSEIFFADDGAVDIRVSTEASLEMSDTPANNSATPTAAQLVSMYQTNSLAIRAIRSTNWKKRRSAAVQFINDAMYAA